jgi:hypothetical protein
MTVKIIRHFIAVPLLLLFVALIPSSAQGILPVSFDDWSSKTPTGTTIVSIFGPSSVLQEYGFASGEQATYSRGSENMAVTLYRMKDPSGAYGMYSYLRSPDMSHLNEGNHSVLSPEHAVLLTGNLILDVTGKNLERYGPNLDSLTAMVSRKAEQGPLPTLTEHLPVKGFIDRSDKYILGPVALNAFFRRRLARFLPRRRSGSRKI